MHTSYKWIWTGPKSALEQAQIALTEVLWPPANAVSLIKDDAAAEDTMTTWRLEAYFTEEPALNEIGELLAASGVSQSPKREELPDKDWVAHALSGLGVVRAGRFILYGVHDADKIDVGDNDIPIRIDANQAFGTGHHPTTAGCLTLLDRFAGFAPKSVFDLGCGSAILAIAAAKLWGRDVLASDIDATSIEIAKENAALNDTADRLTLVEAAGFAHDKITESAPFDFVFANILAGPLKELAEDMAAHIKKNGRVMLAGLMAEQEEGVVEAYNAAGFRLINRLDHETWPVLLLVREG